jgi:antitoxin HicB
MDVRYPAVLEAQENGALLVRFVDLDDTFTEGATAELARSLETSWPSAQRLENPRHSPTLRQQEQGAALGKPPGAGLGMTAGTIQRRLPCS